MRDTQDFNSLLTLPNTLPLSLLCLPSCRHNKTIEDTMNYKQKTIEERRDHTDINTPCVFRPSSHNHQTYNRKALMKHLGLTKQDVEGMSTNHLCHHDTNCEDGVCVSPLHLYFGTHSENRLDLLYGHHKHNERLQSYDPLSVVGQCPSCGWTSAAKTDAGKRRSVARHIHNNACGHYSNAPDYKHHRVQSLS